MCFSRVLYNGLHPAPIFHLHELIQGELLFPPSTERFAAQRTPAPSGFVMIFIHQKTRFIQSSAWTPELKDGRNHPNMFSLDLQALCATGCLTITPAGPTDSPTPPSACRAPGIFLGTIKVGNLWIQLPPQPPFQEIMCMCACSSAWRGVSGM